MKITNLTPHAITAAGQTFPPSGELARVAMTTETVGIFAGIPLTSSVSGDVTGLPEPEPETLFSVSAMVRLAVPTRQDVASPGQLLRDESGAVVGCASLDVNLGEVAQ
jgi:hypothetical protein